MTEKNDRPARRRWLIALVTAATLLVAVVAGLTISGWMRPPAQEVGEAAQPLSEQEIAEVKAAVERQTGTAIRYVGPRNRQGVVEAFPGPLLGQPCYRVKKTDEGWKVIEKFLAFFA